MRARGGVASRERRAGGAVSTVKLIALVLLVAVAATLLQPARAEAIEPMTVIAIVSVAVGVLIIIAVVVIANVRDRQKGEASEPPVIAFDPVAVQAL